MDFVGSQKILARLERILSEKKPAQAYLFSGPSGTGKFMLARLFAASLIENSSKLEIDQERSKKMLPDLILVAPEIEEKKGIVKEKNIDVESVRAALAKLATFPHSGKHKVLVVRQAQKMNASAQNALLKTLEEPNETSILILVCDEEAHLLPTLKSRCQSFSFNILSDDELEKMMPKNQEKREELLLLALGRPAILHQMLESEEILNERRELAKKMQNVTKLSVVGKIGLAEELSKNSQLAIKALEILIWRERKNFTHEKVFTNIEKIEHSIEVINRTNANVRLLLENLLLNL